MFRKFDKQKLIITSYGNGIGKLFKILNLLMVNISMKIQGEF